MAEKKSVFQFKGYKIIESSIRLDQISEPSPELNVSFNQTVGVNEGDHKVRLEMVCTIMDKNEALKVVVKALGFFVFEDIPSAEDKETFFRVSAPAILFPYIRAYITSLTALSGIKPVILPTLNLTKR